MEKKVFVENIVRLVETNLDGKKTVKVGLRDVRGVSFMFGNTISNLCGFGDKKIAELSNEEKKKLEDMILNPGKYNIPSWMLNRRKSETGEDKHITVSTLQLTTNMDINELKKLRCYKGVRHSQDLPVRGQRTRGSFRKGKTVGVRKKAVPSGGKN
ncbi:MAG: 30S ribosomal protein S13 [Candidatus Aenigmarchaeota archaeon]|nr:30S ribosomal protein S13 [Candidatus Aenigmarchaeota archaeon]